MKSKEEKIGEKGSMTLLILEPWRRHYNYHINIWSCGLNLHMSNMYGCITFVYVHIIFGVFHVVV